MELKEIVMKLVGPVQPVGDSNADRDRLANMETLTDLLDKLLFEVNTASHSADRPEASMKAIGEHARNFLDDVRSA